MAELQVEAKYETPVRRSAFTVMCALFPLWALIVPAMLGYVIGHTISNPADKPVLDTVISCLSLFGFILLGLLGTALAEDSSLYASKSGLAFPLYLLPRLGFRRNRNWSDLSAASLVDEGKKKNLLFSFTSGGSLAFDLSRFKAKQIEELLLAVELWGLNCKRNADLISYQQNLQAIGKDDSSTPGYTKMWEEELSRRFSATTFVPLEPDQTLRGGSLKIVRQLAFGGLSAIYLAQSKGSELVVIKEAVIPGSGVSDVQEQGNDQAKNQAKDANDAKDQAKNQAKDQAEKFLARESQMLSRLNHPNIARVFDYFVEDGRHYLQLEYINGADLRQYVRQNGAPGVEQALTWAITIAEILEYLHGQNPPVIHKDLTPDNLVLCNDGRIVLIDFGASNQFISKATNTIVGKQAYIPPEQLRGKTLIQSDIYALGGTIHYLLTGKEPKALSSSHPRKIDDSIPAVVDDIVARATAFESADRYQSADELAVALKAALSRMYERSQ